MIIIGSGLSVLGWCLEVEGLELEDRVLGAKYNMFIYIDKHLHSSHSNSSDTQGHWRAETQQQRY